MILVLKLTEGSKIENKVIWFKKSLKLNIQTAKDAIKNIFSNSKLKTFLIYRSLSHHMLFLWIILLPVLSEKWMEDWYSWFVTIIWSLWAMIAAKYAYKFWEKYSYNTAWILGITIQWVLLVAIWLLLDSWIAVITLYFLFNLFDWLWQPSWNHVLVELTNWKAIATTRSIIFSYFPH